MTFVDLTQSNYKRIPVFRLRELLDELPDEAWLSAQTLGRTGDLPVFHGADPVAHHLPFAVVRLGFERVETFSLDRGSEAE